MNADEKSHARRVFQIKILKSNGQAFEDLFTEIMSYKEPDFQPIEPWGNIGDRKNDGYIPSKGIFYQVYAPKDIRKSYPKVIKKIKTDFAGLIKHWDNVREFYFVVNDKMNGVNADSEKLLAEIKKDNHLGECKFIIVKDLENILFSLTDDEIKTILHTGSIDKSRKVKKQTIKKTTITETTIYYHGEFNKPRNIRYKKGNTLCTLTLDDYNQKLSNGIHNALDDIKINVKRNKGYYYMNIELINSFYEIICDEEVKKQHRISLISLIILLINNECDTEVYDILVKLTKNNKTRRLLEETINLCSDKLSDCKDLAKLLEDDSLDSEL